MRRNSPPESDVRAGSKRVGADQLGISLNSSAVHLLRALSVVDRDSGLTAARLSLLSVLVFGGPMSLKRLAAIEDVTPPTMTRLANALVHSGLAVRDAGDDRRSVVLTATKSGTALMMRARQARIDTITAAMTNLSDDDLAALRSATMALERLTEHVRARAAELPHPSRSRRRET